MGKLTNDANWTFDGYINGVQFDNSHIYQDTLTVLGYWQAAKEQFKDGRVHPFTDNHFTKPECTRAIKFAFESLQNTNVRGDMTAVDLVGCLVGLNLILEESETLEDYRERLLNYILENEDLSYHTEHLQWYIKVAQLNTRRV
jgi:hypothetical protein